MGKKTRRFRHLFWALVLVTVFFAGWQTRGERSFQRGFETGYNTAANHISTRIRTGMREMQPFYLADIGFRFSPRGLTITHLKFTGDEAVYSAKAEEAK